MYLRPGARSNLSFCRDHDELHLGMDPWPGLRVVRRCNGGDEVPLMTDFERGKYGDWSNTNGHESVKSAPATVF